MWQRFIRCLYIIFYFFLAKTVWPQSCTNLGHLRRDHFIRHVIWLSVCYKPLHFYPATSPSLGSSKLHLSRLSSSRCQCFLWRYQKTEKWPITFDCILQRLFSHVWKKSKRWFASVSFLLLSIDKCSSSKIFPYWELSLSGYTGNITCDLSYFR